MGFIIANLSSWKLTGPLIDNLNIVNSANMAAIAGKLAEISMDVPFTKIR